MGCGTTYCRLCPFLSCFGSVFGYTKHMSQTFRISSDYDEFVIQKYSTIG